MALTRPLTPSGPKLSSQNKSSNTGGVTFVGRVLATVGARGTDALIERPLAADRLDARAAKMSMKAANKRCTCARRQRFDIVRKSNRSVLVERIAVCYSLLSHEGYDYIIVALSVAVHSDLGK